LGAYVQQQRLRLGLSQRQLAAQSGVSYSVISRLEGGQKTDMRVDEQFQGLADALKVDVSRLLKFKGVRPQAELPPIRAYFRRKLGVDANEAEVLAQLVAEYQRNKRASEDEEAGPWIG
jgi:transcriptional regulator with XRE-family HTH domain